MGLDLRKTVHPRSPEGLDLRKPVQEKHGMSMSPIQRSGGSDMAPAKKMGKGMKKGKGY